MSLPEQVQVKVPAADWIDGVRRTWTARPTEVVAVEPETEITPPVEVEAAVTLPTTATEQSAVTVVGIAVPPTP